MASVDGLAWIQPCADAWAIFRLEGDPAAPVVWTAADGFCVGISQHK